jgi:prepilin-type N-terminal cleavage/methylation domain-containing protein
MKRNSESGFTLLEVMTAVAVMGILVAMAFPSMSRMLERQETKSSATQMAGLLADARARAVAEGTPHLVYFNAPSVDGNGNCAAVAVEVRDVDHSYSITEGDQTTEFHLPDSACTKVKPFDPSAASSDSAEAAAAAPVPMPREDLAVKAPDAAEVGAVAAGASGAVSGAVAAAANTVGAIAGSGSGSSGSGSSGSSGEDSSGSDDSGNDGQGKALAAGQDGLPPRTSTVAETAVNGATFPVDTVSGRPVIAFSERGIPVDPSNPNSWGSGAGGMYLTDSSGSTIVAALVEPLGDVKMRTYDPASQTWK